MISQRLRDSAAKGRRCPGAEPCRGEGHERAEIRCSTR